MVAGGLIALALLLAPPAARDAIALSAIIGAAVSTLASWLGGLPLAFAAAIKHRGDPGSALALVVASTVLRLMAVAAVTGALLWRTNLSRGALLLAVAGIYLALLPLDVRWALDASGAEGAK